MMQSVLFRIPGGSRSLNLRFLGLQPAQRLPDLLATADIHLLPQKAEAADLVMPRKLTGMLASARAVVATAKPGTELVCWTGAQKCRQRGSVFLLHTL